MEVEAENVRVYWVSCALWLAHRVWGRGLVIGQLIWIVVVCYWCDVIY